ncbi:unnamed protein product [Brassica oleracea]
MRLLRHLYPKVIPLFGVEDDRVSLLPPKKFKTKKEG